MVKDFLAGFLALVQRPGSDWGLQERRGLVRLRCEYKCLYAHGSNRAPGVITDLGEGGLGLRLTQALAVGQELRVFCPFIELEGNFSPVQGTLAWVRPGPGSTVFAGLRYSSQGEELAHSWVGGVLHLLGFPPESILSRRRWVRADCSMEAELNNRPVRIVNLGVGGALLTSAQVLEPGMATLTLPHLKLEGHLHSMREDQGLHWYVLQFPEVPAESLTALGKLIKQLLRQGWKSRKT